MSKLAKWVLAAALVAVAAGGAQAQRQPGGGGRGMGMQQSIFMTALTNAELQKELKITDDQKKALKPMMDKAEEQSKKMREMFAGGGGPPDREVMQKMMEDGRKLGEEAKALAEKTLTPEQVKRAKQIEVQVMGLRAFANEEVAKALKVTDDQKEKVKGIMEEYGKESADLRQEYGIRGFGGGGGGGGNVDQAKMAEYQKKNKALTDETTEKVMKAMTDEQKKAWKEMTGEPFDTTKLMPRPMRRDN
jgi:hypothetical protein